MKTAAISDHCGSSLLHSSAHRTMGWYPKIQNYFQANRDSHTPLLFFFHKYTKYDHFLPSTPDQVSELATFHSQECPARLQSIDRLSEISRFALNTGEKQNENMFS